MNLTESLIPSQLSVTSLLVGSAFIIDSLIGDPGLLHPVRLMGNLISKLESILRRYLKTPEEEKIGGFILMSTVVITVFVISYTITWVIINLSKINKVFDIISSILILYIASTTIALKGLIDYGRKIKESLRKNNLQLARKILSNIVGRDTGGLDVKGVSRATIESVSENLSDGVIAPLFYLMIGGVPLAMVYKAINTLDSMVGYRDHRYRHLGLFSARMDDIVNYIPARISGLLISLSAFIYSLLSIKTKTIIYSIYDGWKIFVRSFKTMLRDGRKHLSPNSGIPEASIAGAIGIKLGGPSTYHGVLVEKPWIGEELSGDYINALERSLRIVYISGISGLIIFMGMRCVIKW